MRLPACLFVFVGALAAGCQSTTDPRYYDYSGSDGCKPANIGHRLGGDLAQFGDNSIAGLRGISGMQQDRCFKNWEFDLAESADGLVLFHDAQYKGTPITESAGIAQGG